MRKKRRTTLSQSRHATASRLALRDDEAQTYDLALEGHYLSLQAADALERQVQTNPEELSSRIRLLGHYLTRAKTQPQRNLRAAHALWIVLHEPSAVVTGTPFVHLSSQEDSEHYQQCKRAWLEHIDLALRETSATSYRICRNALHFFWTEDSAISDELRRTVRLALKKELLDLRTVAPFLSLRDLERSLRGQEESIEYFYHLKDLMDASLQAGLWPKVEAYARALIERAGRHVDDWNYGNALHFGNIALGRVAMARGEVEAAKTFLGLAGSAPSSPQLASFGPNMSLAKALLEVREVDAVLEFMTRCAVFWAAGAHTLSVWRAEISNGEMPDFGANMGY